MSKPLKLDVRVLDVVHEAALVWLIRSGASQQLADAAKSEDPYHKGFFKTRLPHDVVSAITSRVGATLDDAQVELVLVEGDTSDAYHVHKEANALCTALGLFDPLPRPTNAWVHVDGLKAPFEAGETILIPSGLPHTFNVEVPGYLSFLSTQSPPIDGEHDDFHDVHWPSQWQTFESVTELRLHLHRAGHPL